MCQRFGADYIAGLRLGTSVCLIPPNGVDALLTLLLFLGLSGASPYQSRPRSAGAGRQRSTVPTASASHLSSVALAKGEARSVPRGGYPPLANWRAMSWLRGNSKSPLIRTSTTTGPSVMARAASMRSSSSGRFTRNPLAPKPSANRSKSG
jgi:hypothetical protein